MANTEDIGPDSLDPFLVPDDGRRWIVVHTRPRCEKKAERLCRQEGIDVYLPLRSKSHSYGGRKKTFSSPLFSGYVFSVVNDSQEQYLRQNRNVANILKVNDPSGLVSTLNAIRSALAAGDVAEVFPHLQMGQRVVIREGPLKGVEGILERWKDRMRIIINVEMIQQSVAVEMDVQQIAPT